MRAAHAKCKISDILKFPDRCGWSVRKPSRGFIVETIMNYMWSRLFPSAGPWCCWQEMECCYTACSAGENRYNVGEKGEIGDESN